MTYLKPFSGEPCFKAIEKLNQVTQNERNTELRKKMIKKYICPDCGATLKEVRKAGRRETNYRGRKCNKHGLYFEEYIPDWDSN